MAPKTSSSSSSSSVCNGLEELPVVDLVSFFKLVHYSLKIPRRQIHTDILQDPRKLLPRHPTFLVLIDSFKGLLELLLLAFARPRDLVVVVRLAVLLNGFEEFPGLHTSPAKFLDQFLNIVIVKLHTKPLQGLPEILLRQFTIIALKVAQHALVVGVLAVEALDLLGELP